MRSAILRKDTRSLEAMLASSFTGSDSQGRYFNRADLMNSFYRQMYSYTDAVYVDKIEFLKVRGVVAVANGNKSLKATVVGRDRKKHSVSTETRFEDRWVRTGAGWKFVATNIKGSKVFVDGKLSSLNTSSARRRPGQPLTH